MSMGIIMNPLLIRILVLHILQELVVTLTSLDREVQKTLTLHGLQTAKFLCLPSESLSLS